MLKNIFNRFISKYSLRYPRSIAYMLQASEYKPVPYLKWWLRVEDFCRVEKRKSLVKTQNAKIFLSFSWLIYLASYAAILGVLVFANFDYKYAAVAAMALLAPYILAFGVLLLVFAMKIFYLPKMHFLIKKRTAELEKHKGLKIGIAGSFGKTTMREILKTVLSAGKKVASPEKNYNTLTGISNFIKTLKGDEEILIFELGEYYKGDIREMCEFVHPQIGIITGVNEAHLEKFKNLDTTASTIFELADWLEENKKNTGEPCENFTQGSPVLYINGENEPAKSRAQSKDFVYSRSGLDGLRVSSAHAGLEGTSFTLEYEGKNFEFNSGLLGLHQVGPLCAAVHLGLCLGIKISDLQKGVAETKPFEHRLEPKTLAGGVTMLDDSYNGNPDGVKVVIEFLASLKSRRRFYVTPGLVEMGPRTEEVHKEIGRELARSGIEKIVLVKNSVTPYIEAGLKEENFAGEVIWFEDSLKMLSALPHLTVSGDIVLLQNDWPDQYY